MKHFLIIGDPVEGLKSESDTSIAILRECLRQGFKVFWADSKEIFWEGRSLCFEAFEALSCDEKKLHRLDAA